MYNYSLIFCLCIILTACDIVRIKIGKPIVEHQTVNFFANGKQWTYDTKIVRQNYYNAGESDVFDYIDFYVHIIDQDGKVSNLKDKVYVLQKNGTYKNVNVPMLAELNGLTVLVNKSQMYIMLENSYDFTVQQLSDCEIPSVNSQQYIAIGKFDERKQIFLIDKVLLSPLFEETYPINSEGPQKARTYQGNLVMQPFNCI